MDFELAFEIVCAVKEGSNMVDGEHFTEQEIEQAFRIVESTNM